MVAKAILLCLCCWLGRHLLLAQSISTALTGRLLPCSDSDLPVLSVLRHIEAWHDEDFIAESVDKVKGLAVYPDVLKVDTRVELELVKPLAIGLLKPLGIQLHLRGVKDLLL